MQNHNIQLPPNLPTKPSPWNVLHVYAIYHQCRIITFNFPPNFPKSLHQGGEIFLESWGEVEYFVSAFLIYCHNLHVILEMQNYNIQLYRYSRPYSYKI